MSSQSEYFKCSLCSYFSTRKYDLKRHEKVHGDNHQCKQCGGGFVTFIGLEKHMKCCKNGVYVDDRRSIDGRKIKEDPDEKNLEGSRTNEKDPEEEEIEKSLVESLRAIIEDIDEDDLLGKFYGFKVKFKFFSFNFVKFLFFQLNVQNQSQKSCKKFFLMVWKLMSN